MSSIPVAIFNILACVGWSAVNVIVGAQLLNAVNTNVPGWAGIIIIAAATFLVTLFGYKVVHAYEYYSWLPCFIIFLIVLGEFAHSGAFSNIPMGVGNSEAGSILSFASSVFGFGTGWTSYAADYTVYQPANVSRLKIYLWTFAGLMFPLLFTEMLGLAVMTASVHTESYAAGYKASGIGGLLAAVLFPPLGRFGQFCLVVLALSIVANNCPNIYSVTFSLQVMGRWTQAVPRFIWTFIGTLVYCAIAIPGYSHFEYVLEDFMLLIVSAPPCVLDNQILTFARAIGLPSMKVSQSRNMSSTNAASLATTSPSISPHPNYRPALPQSAPSASASSVPSWAWRSFGLSDPLADASARRDMEVMWAFRWHLGLVRSVIPCFDISRRRGLGGRACCCIWIDQSVGWRGVYGLFICGYGTVCIYIERKYRSSSLVLD